MTLGIVQAALARADAVGDNRDGALRAVRPLLHDPSWLRPVLEDALAAMAADPLHLPRFAASRNGFVSHLALARAGRVTVGVTLIASAASRSEAVAEQPPQATFSGQWTLTRLLSADPLAVRRVSLRRDGQHIVQRRGEMKPCETIALDEGRQALWIAPPERSAALLRVRIRPPCAAPSQRFDLLSGHRLAVIQGDDGQARTAMLMSVLRALDAREALPVMAQIVEELEGPARWGAMREWLALDAASAWPRLVAMATSETDPALRHAAAATIARFTPLGAQAA
jgi:hypothetical protein